MIGTATRAQGTFCVHPREAFCWVVNTSNWALPVPSVPVTPKVSLLGSAAPPTSSDSGASPAQPPLPPSYTVPFAASKGTQCWTGAVSKSAHCRGSVDGAPAMAARSAVEAYWSSRYGGYVSSRLSW